MALSPTHGSLLAAQEHRPCLVDLSAARGCGGRSVQGWRVLAALIRPRVALGWVTSRHRTVGSRWMVGEDRGKPAHVVTRAADLQEKRTGHGRAGHGRARDWTGLDWTGMASSVPPSRSKRPLKPRPCRLGPRAASRQMQSISPLVRCPHKITSDLMPCGREHDGSARSPMSRSGLSRCLCRNQSIAWMISGMTCSGN